MPPLPVMLNLQGRRCLVVGGGEVAVRRVAALRDTGAEVTVVAPTIDPRLRGQDLSLVSRAFEPADLDGVSLVVIATDDPAVNAMVAEQAAARHVIINHAQRPELGDVTIPAHRRLGPLTITAHTDHISAAAAASICDAMADALDPLWPTLLTEAAPFRRLIQQRFPQESQRRERLRRLCDDAAMQVLRREGVAALRLHLHSLVEGVRA